MKHNLHNISKGNAPPGGKGNPFFTVISKEERLRDLLLQSSEVTDSSPDESGFGMTSISAGILLLNMRDGPRGRAPAIRFVTVNGLVTLIKKSSVSLCESSVRSVVKKFLPQRTQSRHRGHRVIYKLNPIKAFRTNCTENGRLQEEKGLEGLAINSVISTSKRGEICNNKPMKQQIPLCVRNDKRLEARS